MMMNEPGRTPNPATVEAFKLRKLLCMVITAPVVTAFLIALVQYKGLVDLAPMVGIPEDAIIWGGLALTFFGTVGIVLVWRCPECGGHLGREFGVTACPDCGTPLTHDGRPQQ